MILLIGFTSEEIKKIMNEVNERFRLVDAEESMEILDNIIRRNEKSSYKRLGDERIVLFHDIENDKIRELIFKMRKIIPEHIIFATTTPTSLKWKVGLLIEELKEEDRYFMQRKKEE